MLLSKFSEDIDILVTFESGLARSVVDQTIDRHFHQKAGYCPREPGVSQRSPFSSHVEQLKSRICGLYLLLKCTYT